MSPYAERLAKFATVYGEAAMDPAVHNCPAATFKSSCRVMAVLIGTAASTAGAPVDDLDEMTDLIGWPSDESPPCVREWQIAVAYLVDTGEMLPSPWLADPDYQGLER